MSDKKIFLLAEKPSVASDYARAILGQFKTEDGFKVGQLPDGAMLYIGSAVGHLMALVPPQHYSEDYKWWRVESLPIAPIEWRFIMGAIPQTKREFLKITRFVKGLPPGSEIVNGCDSGREGELIFQSLMDSCVKDRSQYNWTRLWTNEMTESKLRKAFAERKNESHYEGLKKSAYARTYADWFLGINMTRLATKGTEPGVFGKKPKRCGRVKSPLLALVVRRDLAIENFKAQDIFKVKARFPSLEKLKNPWVEAELTHYTKNAMAGELLGVSTIDPTDKRSVFWEKAKAQNFVSLCEQAPHEFIVSDETSQKTVKPPLPFSLTHAQREANKRYGMSAQETLDVLQSLYEKKLMSYPRTDCSYYTEDMQENMCDHLVKISDALKRSGVSGLLVENKVTSNEIIANSKVFNNSKVGDHYALTVTGQTQGLENLSSIEKRIFMMVYERTLMALDEASLVSVVTRTWMKSGVDENNPYSPIVFRKKLEAIKYAGWQRWKESKLNVDEHFGELDEDEEKASTFELSEGKTTAPAHFTEATLLAAMEAAGTVGFDVESFNPDLDDSYLSKLMRGKGLGTPATRAGILEELFKDDYLVRSKKGKSVYIQSTQQSRQLFHELENRCPAFNSPMVTADWEYHLLKMEKGDSDALSLDAFLDRLRELFVKAKKNYERAGLPFTANGFKKAEALGELDILCPKTGERMKEFPKYYTFAGWPKLKLPKVLFNREMESEIYVPIMRGILEKKPPLIKFLSSRTNKPYEAHLVLKDDPKYGVSFKLKFPSNKSGV